jgi:hypothetical protein
MASSSPSTPSESRRGLTRQRRDNLAEPGEAVQPRRPDERDESSDSQDQQEVRGVIKQAHDDLQRGLQDTDRKPVADRAYEQQKGGGVPGTAPAEPDRSGTGATTPR